jgi:hypothetical protein
MKTLVAALIAAGLIIPSFALMEQDQPKAERKKNEKRKDDKKKENEKQKGHKPKA